MQTLLAIQRFLELAGLPAATINEAGFLLELRPKMNAVALFHKIPSNQKKLTPNEILNILNIYKITLINCGFNVTSSPICLYISTI